MAHHPANKTTQQHLNPYLPGDRQPVASPGRRGGAMICRFSLNGSLMETGEQCHVITTPSTEMKSGDLIYVFFLEQLLARW